MTCLCSLQTDAAHSPPLVIWGVSQACHWHAHASPEVRPLSYTLLRCSRMFVSRATYSTPPQNSGWLRNKTGELEISQSSPNLSPRQKNISSKMSADLDAGVRAKCGRVISRGLASHGGQWHVLHAGFSTGPTDPFSSKSGGRGGKIHSVYWDGWRCGADRGFKCAMLSAVRIQQRNGRKCLTTVQGLDNDLDLKRICKAMKKAFNCNGNSELRVCCLAFLTRLQV